MRVFHCLKTNLYSALDNEAQKKAYEDLADRIMKFDNIEMSPVFIDVNKLRGTETLGESLYNNSAKYHKSCKLKFGNEKLQRAIKKNSQKVNVESGTTPKSRSTYKFLSIIIRSFQNVLSDNKKSIS